MKDRYPELETATLDPPEKAVLRDPRVKQKKKDSHGKGPHRGGFFNAKSPKEKDNG